MPQEINIQFSLRSNRKQALKNCNCFENTKLQLHLEDNKKAKLLIPPTTNSVLKTVVDGIEAKACI